ncbi:DUF6602 domain-containing protein [Paenibacillus pinihumi]|uniref:DUF6602 domain-containing protein n=1 Tax=Paenibacillus pinihumi TaxID=669462 RepID=UPI000414AA0E|nr:DUF6602 domain-containing protein [Paenibacillus pinihumi]
MSSDKRNNKIIASIANNFIQTERYVVNQLKFENEHHVTMGSFREEVWKSLFEQIIPKKFSIEQSVFIIDSKGQVSKEVDLAIFDEQYTPYIFNFRKIKVIPIEAVAAVIQCKSRSLKPDNLVKWTESIDVLRTSLKSVARLYSNMATGEYGFELDEEGIATARSKSMQTSTRPIKILCHTNEDYKQGGGWNKHFDFILNPENDRLKVTIVPDEKEDTLQNWHSKLNHTGEDHKLFRQNFDVTEAKDIKLKDYRVFKNENEEDEVALLSLTFQLNQLLMLINNPIMFPHKAYADMFREVLKEKRDDL